MATSRSVSGLGSLVSGGLVALLLLMCAPAIAEAKKGQAKVGKTAPWFSLRNLTDTRTVSNKSLRGKPTLLVVGRTTPSAPQCKKWMLSLLKRHGKEARVLQVIVVKKPWFMPRSLVLKKVRGFVPRAHHGKTLLEWYTVFSDVWGIPKVDDPFIYLLDARGMIRHHHRGKATRKAVAAVGAALEKLGK